jgi:hypothetical protein
MTEKTFVPFEEFYKPEQVVEVEQKSESEILAEVKGILDSLSKGGG